MKHAVIVAALFSAVLLAGCFETEVNFEPLKANRGYSMEIAHDVQIYYSDSSRMRVSVEGSELKRYIYKFRVEEEFPNGVHVEFYDENEVPSAWLDARYAIRKPTEKQIVARDSVVLYNKAGGRIESSELIWDERSRMLSTDRFVQIIRPPGDTLYSYGFETNETFTDYKLFSVEGNVSVQDFDSSYD